MNRAHLALVVAGTLSAGIAAVAQAQAPSTLPDLDERLPERVAVQPYGTGYAIGFDTTIVNVGAGPFVLHGSRSAPTGDMVAEQIVGTQRQTVGAMRYITTFGHEHWHLVPFQRYELRGADGRVVPDVKQGFCLSDLYPDGWCAQGKPGETSLDMGLRPGGNDKYERFLEGQQIPITSETAPTGRYTLVVRVDPNSRFQEENSSNNMSSVALDLRWSADGSEPSLTVVQTCLHSQTCPPAPPPPPQPEQSQPPATAPAPASAPVQTLAPNAAPAVLRMTLAKAYRLGRVAVRREYSSARARTAKLRISSCRADVRKRVKCNVRWRTRKTSYRGTIWLAAFDGPPRWGYQLRVTGRVRNCSASKRTCTRRLARPWKMGGSFAAPRTS